MTKYGIYEYEKVSLDQMGDFERWEYKIKNTETGKKFIYRVAISSTALASEGLREDIQSVVNSQGDSLITVWLEKNIEERRQAQISKKDIKIKTVSMQNQWNDWRGF